MASMIITATDTDVGKTVVAAMLLLAVDGIYWKPIQSGRDGGTDTETVRRLTGFDDSHFRAERYVLSQPLSPHQAADIDGISIDTAELAPPADLPGGRPLLIEGAGGVLVPITRRLLQVELFRRWRAPAVICARTRLGTINHTLLTVAALRHHHVPIFGIIFVGDAMPDTERTIAEFAGARVLGRLPPLSRLDRDTLIGNFHAHFRPDDFSPLIG
jgi:dethiobiotin synthetase